MSAQIIDGKLVSKALRQKVAAEVAQLAQSGVVPGLAVIIVGEDPASQIYVRNKVKACEECGIYSEKYALDEDTSECELLELIEKLNADPKINGILCQLPLPSHIDENKVINAISPDKDVDAFHPVNVGKIMTGSYTLAPCTPAGVMELLDYYGIDPAGKRCVVVGRSNIVGKPQAMLLLHKNGTVTICHSKTRDLRSETLGADILVCAIGRAKMFTADMIKPGAVVIDVGINRGEDGKICGDVDFENAKEVASFITPVPGGVGPMTISVLMKNTLAAAKAQNGIK